MMGRSTARSSLWIRSDFSQREALIGKVETTIVSYEFCSNHLLGYPQVRNYDGSWTEWGNVVGAPIEKP
jgi:hypothetical protein